MQVSRDSNLKIPKKIENINETINSLEDEVAIKKALANAEGQKFNKDKVLKSIEEDKELEEINQLPYNANDMVLITVVKKLTAYTVAVTEKSPKKFRGVFVNRMQNYCLDTLECLFKANFTSFNKSIDEKEKQIENKKKREELQKNAIVNLKLLGYVAMIAESSGCILKKQYKQISIQLSEAINLISAWKKSDDERFKRI